MKRYILSLLAIVALTIAFAAPSARAGDPYAATQLWSNQVAAQRAWHGNYYYLPYGQPTALIVPPGAHMRQTFSWGVSQNLMYPLNHQYGRSATYPGASAPGSFQSTPHWPSHTDQFGVYYVRGPW
jgi:hypothetical protein